MIKFEVPIWLSDWKFKNKKGNTFKVYDVVVKGFNTTEVINNDFLINRAKRCYNKKKNLESYKPISVQFKSQHGYGVKEKL
jgi:hypothetical protein|tara:strand:- start:1671 stop:1913 length:243 start_codon:yes stop_codon:yes gene_type:complete